MQRLKFIGWPLLYNHITHTAWPRILILSDILLPFFCKVTVPLFPIHNLYSLSRSVVADTGDNIPDDILG
nr:MAG TPA: hypothetical protein [Caudoviricetes sp.]